MGWNSSGVFNRLHSWVTDRDSSVPIDALKMDEEFDEYKAGLENCLTRDGQNSPSADIPWGSNKITGLADGTATNDAVNRGQLNVLLRLSDDSIAVTGTNTLVATFSPAESGYVSGRTYLIVAAADNTTATTININGLGAKNIMVGGQACIGGEIKAAQIYMIRYDGTDFELLNPSPFVKVVAYGSGSGTYTTPARCKSIRVVCTGGGGGGGGTTGVGGQIGLGVAGAGAGTSIKYYASPAASYSYAVGAGGAGGAAGNNAGATGGNSTFGSQVGNGGTGGTGDAASAAGGTKPGVFGGSASNGDLNVLGGDSIGCCRVAVSGVPYLSSFNQGGCSYFGGGGRSVQNATGRAGTAYGSGGAGAISVSSTNCAGLGIA